MEANEPSKGAANRPDLFILKDGGRRIQGQASLEYNPSKQLYRDHVEVPLTREDGGAVGFSLRFIQNSGGWTFAEAKPADFLGVVSVLRTVDGVSFWDAIPRIQHEGDHPEHGENRNVLLSQEHPGITPEERTQKHEPAWVRVQIDGVTSVYQVDVTFTGKPDRWNIAYSVNEGTLPSSIQPVN